ncbi:DUF6221 family protein [Streptomyces sp. NPDC004721]
MDDLAEWLRAQLDEDERIARATHPVFLAWEYDHCVREIRDLGNGNEITSVILPRYGEYMAEWDPERALREIEAKRQLVDDFLSEKHDVVEDCWYTCAAASEERDGGETCDDGRRGGPCDCGRDARVERRLCLLALPYVDRPGYKESWPP